MWGVHGPMVWGWCEVQQHARHKVMQGMGVCTAPGCVYEHTSGPVIMSGICKPMPPNASCWFLMWYAGWMKLSMSWLNGTHKGSGGQVRQRGRGSAAAGRRRGLATAQMFGGGAEDAMVCGAMMCVVDLLALRG